MTGSRPPRLLVDADLRLDVDGVQAQIAGQGDRLYLTTDHPVRLLRAAVPLARTAGSGRTRSALTRLADEGLTVTVVGRHGELAHLGAAGGARRIRVALPVVWRRVAAAVAVSAAILALIRSRRR